MVVPAYHEAEGIARVLDRLIDGISLEFEVLVVVDDADDPTVAAVRDHAGRRQPGAAPWSTPTAAARRTRSATASTPPSHPVVVVTMADGSDDPRMIDPLARLVERGVVVAAASRYSPGGQQVGGPVVQGAALPRRRPHPRDVRPGRHRRRHQQLQGLHTEFVREVGIDSRSGFEIGLELTAKARRLRRPVAELPTIWLDRTMGESRFDLKGWVPKYLRWYRFAFGPELTVEQVRAEGARIAARNEGEGQRDVSDGVGQRVLVTGSAGFIGGYVVEELLGTRLRRDRHRQLLEVRAGHEVVRRPPGVPLRRGRRPRPRPDDRAAR